MQRHAPTAPPLLSAPRSNPGRAGPCGSGLRSPPGARLSPLAPRRPQRGAGPAPSAERRAGGARPVTKAPRSELLPRRPLPGPTRTPPGRGSAGSEGDETGPGARRGEKRGEADGAGRGARRVSVATAPPPVTYLQPRAADSPRRARPAKPSPPSPLTPPPPPSCSRAPMAAAAEPRPAPPPTPRAPPRCGRRTPRGTPGPPLAWSTRNFRSEAAPAPSSGSQPRRLAEGGGSRSRIGPSAQRSGGVGPAYFRRRRGRREAARWRCRPCTWRRTRSWCV